MTEVLIILTGLVVGIAHYYRRRRGGETVGKASATTATGRAGTRPDTNSINGRELTDRPSLPEAAPLLVDAAHDVAEVRRQHRHLILRGLLLHDYVLVPVLDEGYVGIALHVVVLACFVYFGTSAGSARAKCREKV